MIDVYTREASLVPRLTPICAFARVSQGTRVGTEKGSLVPRLTQTSAPRVRQSGNERTQCEVWERDTTTFIHR